MKALPVLVGLLASCGLTACVSVRSAADPLSETSPILLGPVRALAPAPAAPPAPPSSETMEIRSRYSEGAVISMFGPHWERAESATTPQDLPRRRPGVPARVRSYDCWALRFGTPFVFHGSIACAAEAVFDESGPR